LRKMETVILPRQRANKARIREALSKIDQVTFREVPDPSGDTATFLTFSLPTPEKTKTFNKVMAEEGAGAVYWYENFWHYYDEWEHLLGGKSVLRTGYPFKTREGEVRCRYSKGALPGTAAILSRTLSIPINIYMDEQIPKITRAIEKAARAL